MSQMFLKTTSRLVAVSCFAVVLAASSAWAETLPADPWAVAAEQQEAPVVSSVQTGAAQANVVHVQQVGPVVYGSQPYQPTYEGGANNVWNTKMPEFTGEMTTWGDSPNAKYNAPEVNTHNMLAILQHLRNMGYKIPTTAEDRIKSAPAAVRNRIFKAMKDLDRQKDPFSKGARFALKQFEDETGLSYENLIGNSLNLMSAK